MPGMEDMKNSSVIFWQAVAYEGEFRGHGPLQDFSWAAHGTSEIPSDKEVERDEVTRCLLSMRLLFERFSKEKLAFANQSVGAVMTIIIESFPTEQLEFGKFVARLDARRAEDGSIVATLSGPGKSVEHLGSVVLGNDEGVWELVIRLLAHL